MTNKERRDLLAYCVRYAGQDTLRKLDKSKQRASPVVREFLKRCMELLHWLEPDEPDNKDKPGR